MCGSILGILNIVADGNPLVEAFGNSFVAVAGAGGFAAVGTAAARAGNCAAVDAMVVDAGVEGAESGDLPVGI